MLYDVAILPQVYSLKAGYHYLPVSLEYMKGDWVMVWPLPPIQTAMQTELLNYRIFEEYSWTWKKGSTVLVMLIHIF